MATLKFVQAQKFSLAGSGAAIGDTTITLQSMLGIDGVAIVTADIGTGGFGTLEPGNGVQEEAIKFTGITQNANGTATLTGVSHVLFISPYTASSGLTKTHAGATTFILSNDAAFYGAILDYVDNSLMASGIPATNLVAGISKLSVAAASAGNPIAVGDNDPRVLASGTSLYVNAISTTGIPYTIATGTAAAYTATYASGISTLASGTFLNFLVPITNATGITLNVNSLGAKSIKKNASVGLLAGDITIGQVASVVYDGTNFQLLSPNSFVGFGDYSPTSTGLTADTTETTVYTKVLPTSMFANTWLRLTGNCDTIWNLNTTSRTTVTIKINGTSVASGLLVPTAAPGGANTNFTFTGTWQAFILNTSTGTQISKFDSQLFEITRGPVITTTESTSSVTTTGTCTITVTYAQSSAHPGTGWDNFNTTLERFV